MAQRIVGLDIGTSAIRAVELSVGDGQRPTLLAYGQVGLNPGMVVDGEIHDMTGVIGAIQRLWTQGGFNERKVIIGIAGLRAITRELDMPTLPPDELDDAVRFQADEVVPFPMDRTAISSKVIAQYTDAEGAPTIRVLVAVAHRDLIDSVVAAALGAGLEPVGIDLNTAALVRALHDPSFTGGPEAIVSVGAGLTLVVVHQGGVLQFVRTIDLAGESVTKSIASALDLPTSDAENVKKRMGEGGPVDSRAQSACEQAVSELVSEIHNSIRFFSSLPGRSPVARVLVTGAGARTAGFFPKLQEGLDVPVSPASPLSYIDISQLGISPEDAAAINPVLAVPVGLATPEPSGRSFNLLPVEVTRQAEEKRVYRILYIAAAIVVLALIALTVLQVLAVNNSKNQVTTLTSQNNYIQNVEIPRYNKVVQLQKSVTTAQAAIKPTLSGVIDMLSVINQLGDYEPPTAANPTTASYSSVNISTTATAATTATPGGSPVLGSVSVTNVVPTGTLAATWAENLALSPAFINITLGPLGAPSSTGVQFTGTIGVTSQCVSPIAANLTAPVTLTSTKAAS